MVYARLGVLVAAIGVTGVALVAVVACGSSSATPLSTGSRTATPARTTTATSTSTNTTTAAASAAQQALATYRAAFADWVSVESVPGKSDYQSPVLADHMSGQALSTVTNAVYVDTNVKGAVAKGAPVLHPTVGELVPANDPTQVVINDCVDTSNWLLYTPDGHLYNNVPGGREKTQALVAHSAGVWKVTQLYLQPVGTC